MRDLCRHCWPHLLLNAWSAQCLKVHCLAKARTFFLPAFQPKFFGVIPSLHACTALDMVRRTGISMLHLKRGEFSWIAEVDLFCWSSVWDVGCHGQRRMRKRLMKDKLCYAEKATRMSVSGLQFCDLLTYLQSARL